MRAIILASVFAAAAPAVAQSADREAPGRLVGPALFVTDPASSARFYQALGLKIVIEMGPPERRETILTFGGDPQSPGIILLSDGRRDTRPRIEHGHGYDRTVMRMPDLTATAERLRAVGFAPSQIHEVAKGYRVMTVADPDGYQLELVEAGKRP